MTKDLPIRFICDECTDNGRKDPCFFHTENYDLIGAPLNCLFSGEHPKWRSQIMIDNKWKDFEG